MVVFKKYLYLYKKIFMKELRFVTVCPDDVYFTWQVHLWLESLKDIGQSDKAIILLFVPLHREQNKKWTQVMELYPEAEFKFYKDDGTVSPLLSTYIPILRPWTAWKYFSENPSMKDKAVFYCDSDILFMPDFNVDKFLEDDVNYLSDTNSYINASYFDSKVVQVLPEKLEEYNKRDILNEVASKAGISRQVAEQYNLHSGGAQYLLKNIDAHYWKKVMDDTIMIRQYLLSVNREFFKDENSGYQSWCADMWAVLWNLWYRKQETKVIPELNFAWSSDPIEKLQYNTILHNAGIVSETGNGHLSFYKGKYSNNTDPTKDPTLDIIIKDTSAMAKCTGFYATKLKELSLKYNINY
jgi:hypothetical protein